jgi:WD40 repeat protein
MRFKIRFTLLIVAGVERFSVRFSVAFSPGGSKILTGSADGTAMLWDAKIGPKSAADPAIWNLLE